MVLLLLYLWPVFAIPAKAQVECEAHKKEVKAIGRQFGEESEIAPITDVQDREAALEYFHPGDCFYGIVRGDEVLGYLFSTRAKGRFEYFDYSVLFSDDAAVLKVLVTVYRSTHGAGICQKNWLSQFEGYRGGELKIGPDIDAVSGGTLSASSMVKDIQRCQRFVSFWTGE